MNKPLTQAELDRVKEQRLDGYWIAFEQLLSNYCAIELNYVFKHKQP